MSKTNAYHPAFTLSDVENGTCAKLTCTCGAWTYLKWADKKLKHNRGCDHDGVRPSDKAAPVASSASPSASELKAAAEQGEVARVLGTEEQIVDAVNAKVITSDDAMNRDF